MPLWIKAIFIGFGFLVAGGMGWLFVHGEMRASEAQQWPTTPATVIASELERNESTSTSGSSSGRRRTTSVSWFPVVIFSYEVDGKTYRSKNLYLNGVPGYGSEAEGRVFLSDYAAGHQFPLRYNPADPNDVAAIIESPTLLILIFVGVGLILMAVGIFIPGEAPLTRVNSDL